jgi:hypothetical protein
LLQGVPFFITISFVLSFMGAGWANESKKRAGIAGRQLFPPKLTLLSVLTLGVAVLWLVPFPFFFPPISAG